MLIPRGGPSLIRSVLDNATVPYVIDGDGNCHVYVDATADLGMAAPIVENAKTQRPSVCNAAETLLVHRNVAATPAHRPGPAARGRGAGRRRGAPARSSAIASPRWPPTTTTPPSSST